MRKEAFVKKLKNGRLLFSFYPPIKDIGGNHYFDKLIVDLNDKREYKELGETKVGYFSEARVLEDDERLGRSILQITHNKPFSNQEFVDFLPKVKGEYKVVKLKPKTEEHFGDILRGFSQ